MKLDPLQSLPSSLPRGASALSFAGGGDFASKLILGQVIRGRVLRRYQGGRYRVDFDGQPQVVESTVPLQVDEILYGRVVGLSDKVELQRISGPLAATPPAVAAGGVPAPALAVGGGTATILARFEGRLAPAERNLLQRLMARSAVPERMALSGLILAKLGIALSAHTLAAVFEVLQRDRSQSLFACPEQAIELLTQAPGHEAIASPVTSGLDPDDLAVPQSQVAALAALLAQCLDAAGTPNASRARADIDTPSLTDRPPGGYRRLPARDQGAHPRDPDVVRRIFNVQAGGAVAHRVGTLPLLVDGRLMELDIALFDQTAEAQPETADGLTYRQVVFAVSTAALGRVEIQAASAGAHLRLHLSTEAQESTRYLAGHAGRLSADLERLGWRIDELVYRAVPPGAPGMVGHAVVEHLVAPGSVSALA